MSDYSYTSLKPQGEMTLPELGTEVAASFVPGLNVAQALRDYQRAAAENKYVDMGLSALGLIPGVGGAAKAMLLLPAMLRKESKAIQELNKNLLPLHSTTEEALMPGNKLLQSLHNPSFSVSTRRDPIVWEGNDLPNVSFVPRLGKLDPRNAGTSLYSHDPNTPDYAYANTVLNPKPTYSLDDVGAREFPSYAAYLKDPRGAKALSMVEIRNEPLRKAYAGLSDKELGKLIQAGDEDAKLAMQMRIPSVYGELKAWGRRFLGPETFAGAVIDKNTTKALLTELRKRGLNIRRADFDDPIEVWHQGEALQQGSIK